MIDKIIEALSKAQGSYKQLKENQDSSHGKFANLQATIEAVRESLSLNGLGFYQYQELLDEGSGAALIKTVLAHASGQWISSTARVSAGKTERQTGNRIEIAKRRHAQMLLGIAPSINDPYACDDNGEEQSEVMILETMRRPKKEIDDNELITKSQYEDLMIELSGETELVHNIQETYGIDTIADLPRSEYHEALKQIRRIKRTKEEFERRKK